MFFDPARIVVCEASTKAGKSSGCIAWLLHHAINQAPGAAHLWLSPVYPQAKVMFERFTRLLTRMDPHHETGWAENRGDMWVSVPGGARVWFKGGDNPDSIYGSDYSAAVIDESTRCKPQAWNAVVSTLSATNGPVRIIGNVKGRKNWAYNLAQRAKRAEDGMSYYKLTAYDAVDAGILTLEAIENAKQVLPENVFRELYLAEPSDDGGNPFGLDAIRKMIQPPTGGKPVCFGVDLAKSHDFVVAWGIDDDGACTSMDRWQGSWAHTERRLIEMIGGLPALVDSTGVGDPIVERLQRGCPQVEGFKFTSESKQRIMEGLAVAIQQGRFTIPPGEAQGEFESFEYVVHRSRVSYSAPDGLHDDTVCAGALALDKLSRLPRVHATSWADIDAAREGERKNVNIHAVFAKKREDPDWGFD